MPLTSKQSTQIENYLTKVINDKLKNYEPETHFMPFHHRLLGKDRYVMFSFIQSMNTTFGMSIFEQVGEIIIEKLNKKVSLKKSELTLFIEVVEKQAYLWKDGKENTEEKI